MPGNPELIEHYKALRKHRVYGISSLKSLRVIRPEVAALRPGSIIDYGCGQSRLIDSLDVDFDYQKYRYDPAVEAYSVKPNVVADLLINIDVLEHIEEQDLDTVLSEMRSLCKDAYIVVDLAPADLLLPDGRNAHVCLKSADWWKSKLESHFGPMYPTRTIRSTRAGFRTWKRDAGMNRIYRKELIRSYLRHYVGKLMRR